MFLILCVAGYMSHAYMFQRLDILFSYVQKSCSLGVVGQMSVCLNPHVKYCSTYCPTADGGSIALISVAPALTYTFASSVT